MSAKSDKKKPKEENEFYDIRPILGKHAQYNIIVGERSNGKTFAVEEIIIKNYFKTGKQGAIVRRWSEDFKSKRGLHMFDNLINEGRVEKYSKGEYNSVTYFRGAWYFVKIDEDGNTVKDDTPFCFSFALSDMEHDKSVSFPNVTTILFDEFITRSYYMIDEFVTFMNVLSTIIRQRTDVTIFMCGNTVNVYCPYFEEFGLNHVRSMRQGTIDLYTYGSSELKVAVEYCSPTSKKGKPSDIYFAFNNPKLNMIKSGVWEMDIYPHLPYKYLPKDVVFTFFIKFNDEIVQCEVVVKKTDMFCYIHRKTTPLKLKPLDIVYNLESNPEFNIRYSFMKPIDNIDNKILYLYRANKFFYQSNEVGETVRNFIMNSKGV